MDYSKWIDNILCLNNHAIKLLNALNGIYPSLDLNDTTLSREYRYKKTILSYTKPSSSFNNSCLNLDASLLNLKKNIVKNFPNQINLGFDKLGLDKTHIYNQCQPIYTFLSSLQEFIQVAQICIGQASVLNQFTMNLYPQITLEWMKLTLFYIRIIYSISFLNSHFKFILMIYIQTHDDKKELEWKRIAKLLLQVDKPLNFLIDTFSCVDTQMATLILEIGASVDSKLRVSASCYRTSGFLNAFPEVCGIRGSDMDEETHRSFAQFNFTYQFILAGILVIPFEVVKNVSVFIDLFNRTLSYGMAVPLFSNVILDLVNEFDTFSKLNYSKLSKFKSLVLYSLFLSFK